MEDERETRDHLDELLSEYFRPEAMPGDLVRRVLAAGKPAAGDLEAFARGLAIEATARGVSLIRPGPSAKPSDRSAGRLAERARIEIAEYLSGKRAFFSVPVDLSGVPEFQRRVLDAAQGIPFGEARPYAWIAARIGHPGAVRAVGTALGRNPVPLIVPCHRVWRTDGSAGGYIFGIDLKRRLAELERATPVFEGCTSTRIVCRVGCVHGRHMRPDNRVVFGSVADAQSVGYRPCKVCKPSAAA